MASNWGVLVIGMLVGMGLVVGFTDVGPMKINVETNEATGGSGSDVQEVATETPGSDSATAEPTEAESRSIDLDRDRVRELLHEKVNDRRDENYVISYEYKAEVETVAQYYATKMANDGFFAHESPSGESLHDRYDSFGVGCRKRIPSGYKRGGENLFMMESDSMPTPNEIASKAVASWMDSEDHRKHILDDVFESEGIGVAAEYRNGQYEVYVVQNFC